ncbi:hypothetical protein CJF25_05510 [Photobacterium phosphoreum]|uniref:hypothetical protein n=1 Tax=Photobacterium phosphoreum TaxID=659 RepID=UPI001E5F0EEC|nr:hypothetical protein [Photobacterium phosphoreum]MCD9462452.1 hypothetical protein [Photobacterium phosphoreum]MCD9519937.1 hypothetical protein [Photobacterium phosphoreum]
MSLELESTYELKDILYIVGIGLTFVLGLVNVFYNIYISKRTTYINSVTVERVKWINALRENVSKFIGLTYHWVMTDISEDSDESKHIIKEIDQLRILIQLQVNPNEPLGEKIIHLIDKVSLYTHESQKDKLKVILKEIVSEVQQLLKEEWDKVKNESEKGRLYGK